MTAFEFRKPPTAFALDVGRKATGGRVEDRAHLAFIRQLPCVVTGAFRRIEAAHVRYASPEHGKGGTPGGRKPDDRWTVPLAAGVHAEQHRRGERAWWEAQGLDPIAIAAALYAVTGDVDAGLWVVREARETLPPWKR